MDRGAVLVIDVGTSTAHACAIALEDGTLLASGRAPIPWLHPHPGWTETEPEALWNAVDEAVAQAVSCLPEGTHIAAVNGSFQGDVILPVDDQDRPLGNFIVGMDQRGAPYIDVLRREFGAERFQRILGCELALWEPCKYLYLTRERPEVMARARRLVNVQEYVLFRMGLGFHQDETLASRKVMRDLHTGAWSPELCDFTGVTPALLGEEILPSSAVVGEVKRIGRTQLPMAVPVLVGAHDCEMGAIGVGVAPGDGTIVANIAGTNDHISCFADHAPDTTGKPFITFQSPFRGSYVTICAHFVGANVNWGVNRLFPEMGDYAATIRTVFDRIRLDGTGTAFYTGAGIHAAQGTFCRIDLETTREDLFAALIEGSAYPLKAPFDAICAENGGKCRVLRIGGGGAIADKQVQLKADLFRIPIERVANNEISAVGAAALAAVTLGEYSTLREAQEQMVRVRDRFEPDAEVSARYQERYARWQELSNAAV